MAARVHCLWRTHVYQPPYDLRHDVARRRTGARVFDAGRGEADARAAARHARRRRDRGRVSDRVRGRCRGGAHDGDPGHGARSPALARCSPADIDRAGTSLAPRRPAPHPHLHRHLGSASGAQAADDPRGVPRRRGCGSSPRAPVYGRRAVFGRGRDPQRSGLSLPRHRGGHLRRLHDGQPPGHGRLFDAGRDRRVLPHDARRVPNAGHATFSAHCHDDLGSRGGQHACRGQRRRPAGRVHDQRHRRARRQRVARRDRHGDARARRSPAVHDRHRPARDLSRRASC